MLTFIKLWTGILNKKCFWMPSYGQEKSIKSTSEAKIAMNILIRCQFINGLTIFWYAHLRQYLIGNLKGRQIHKIWNLILTLYSYISVNRINRCIFVLWLILKLQNVPDVNTFYCWNRVFFGNSFDDAIREKLFERK